jgi:hypothetical protein
MTAPVASGWSGCRVGLAPTGKRRLSRRTPIADTLPRGRNGSSCPFSDLAGANEQGRGRAIAEYRTAHSPFIGCEFSPGPQGYAVMNTSFFDVIYSARPSSDFLARGLEHQNSAHVPVLGFWGVE